jgi:hypothetical protein
MANMPPEEISRLIDLKIRQHEIRVAVISGIAGGIAFGGIFHAIYLLSKNLL